jgi:hypothetical protein
MKFSLPLLLILLSAAHHADARVWTDVEGRKLEAEFVSASSTEVKVKANGVEHNLPLARLSPLDQTWVRQTLLYPPPNKSFAPLGTTAPAASPSTAPPSTGALSIAGVTVRPGAQVEFETPLSAELQKRREKLTRGTEEYEDLSMDKALVGLWVPPGFDPSKSWPIMIVSVTSTGRVIGGGPSSIRSMATYLDSARANGWVVMAADCKGHLTPGHPYNRSALAEAALDALATAWPASKTWPVATGGFSGGGSYSGWVGTWLAERGRNLVGIFMGGVNVDTTAEALNSLKPNRKAYSRARIFVSTGLQDPIAGPNQTSGVVRSLKGNGFEVREETHPGDHRVNKEHVAKAMEWFKQNTSN